jgi:uncharacterized delta-60 repeat protein
VGGDAVNAGKYFVWLERFNAVGTIDSTFGNHGVVKTFVAAGAGEPSAVNGPLKGLNTDFARLSDGRFVIAAGTFLARYTVDGQLDKTFGGGDGIVHTKMPLHTVRALPGGKLFADPYRFNSDGSLDTTFGVNGAISSPVYGPVAIQKDGKILIAGTTPGALNTTDAALIRFTANGKRDKAFNGGKVVPIDFGFDFQSALDVTVQSNGRIIVAAWDSNDNGYVVGYRTDGSPDPSFKGGEENFSSNLFDEVDGLGLYAADHIAFFGGVDANGDDRHNFDVIGLTQNGVQEFNKVVDFDWIDGQLDDVPAAATMTSDGNILVVGNADAEVDPLHPKIEICSLQGKPGGPSDAAPVSFATNQITVTGTSHSDVIRIFGDENAGNVFLEVNGNRAVGFVEGQTIVVNASGGNDRIENFSNIPCILNGGNGNDTLIGGTGSDTFIGGPGSDTADFSSRHDNLALSLDNLANDGAPGEHDNVMADIETVLAGSGNDKLVGDPFANLLKGNGGNDTIYGGAGNDTLVGGGGHDILFGQDGNDLLLANDGHTDTIDGGNGFDTASRDNGPTIFDRVMNVEKFVG